MMEYILSPQALVMTSGSSVGTQRKYYDHGYWYKQNNLGYEGYVEYLASKVLECSNVEEFVTYETCMVNGRPGCRSENFLKQNESFISFQRMYEMYHGTELNDRIRSMSDPLERIQYTIDFIKDVTQLDCSDYLSKILTLDMLLLNTDRHFHNLGLVVDGSAGIYKTAPIFDNGNALLSDYDRFDRESIEDNIEHVTGQPFSASLEAQASAIGIGLRLDYSKMENMLDEEPDSRAVQVLKYQINRYRNIIPGME